MIPGDFHIKYVPKATSWHLTFWDVGKGGAVQTQGWYKTEEEARMELKNSLISLNEKYAKPKVF